MSFSTEYASGERGGTCLSQTCEFFPSAASALRGAAFKLFLAKHS